MTPVKTQDYHIYFNTECYHSLNAHLQAVNYSKLFILVDKNTHHSCLPYFLEQLETNLVIEIINIEPGETYKTIETCSSVWNALSELDADRKSLLINLGGGVVTDLGGFVASTFKRGIAFINVPTTLLAMVDASIGGKTGVDLGVLKNQIGVINTSKMVLIDTSFLKTLPPLEIRSGLAEMLKHGLIYNKSYWKAITTAYASNFENLDPLIYESIIIKKDIVEEDPFENGLRKTLNYGHTLGHAIESYFLSHHEKTTLLHGEAIAIGMVLATYLSKTLTGFPSEECDAIKATLKSIYGHVEISETDQDAIIVLLKHDKKNENGNVNFVLLEEIGKAKVNCIVENSLIKKSFKFYSE